MTNGKLTGEGFAGEKALAIISVVLTIASTILLIELTIWQRKHTLHELSKQEEDVQKKAELESNKTNPIKFKTNK